MSAPGWYPDRSGQLRYWDGAQWTRHVAPVPAPRGSGPSAGRVVALVLALAVGVPAALVGLVYTAGWLARAAG